MPLRHHRVGIIGFGSRGRSHASNLRANYGDRAEVVAAADTAFSGDGADGLPPERCFRDYRDLLALPDLDAVIIATYEAAHVEACVAAIEAGKVPLVEKAVAPTWPEAVRLYRYVRARGRPFMLALNLRHFPAARAVREVLGSGTIGRVSAATVHVNAGSHWGADCFRRFYADRSLCGDLVLSKLTHDSDLIQHLLGARVTRVAGYAAKTVFVPKPGAGADCDHCAITAECTEYVSLADPTLRARSDERVARGGLPLSVCPFTRPSTSHDTATFVGLLDSGAAFTFVFTTAGPIYERRFTFNGTTGQIDCVLHGPGEPRVTVQRTNGQPELWPVPDVAGGHGGADPSLMASFLDYLDSAPSAPREPVSILTSVLVPLGGLDSSETGRAVDLAAWYRDATAED